MHHLYISHLLIELIWCNPDNKHNPHIEGMNPEHGIILASRPPDVTHWDEELQSFRADGGLDMDLVEIIAEHSGHLSQWRELVQFLKDFQMKKWFSIRRSTIDQIVQQEWFGAG